MKYINISLSIQYGNIINIIIIIVNVSSGGGRHVVVWAEQIDRGQIGGVACQLLLTSSQDCQPAKGVADPEEKE